MRMYREIEKHHIATCACHHCKETACITLKSTVHKWKKNRWPEALKNAFYCNSKFGSSSTNLIWR